MLGPLREAFPCKGIVPRLEAIVIQWKWPPSISTAKPSSNKQLSRGCAFGIFMVALIMFGSIIILAALLPMNRLVQTQATAEAVRVARIAEKAVTRARFQREAD